MQRVWADKAVRISAGAALLLLLAAEGKVCPALLAPPVEPDAAQRAAESAGSPPAPDSRSKPSPPEKDEQSPEPLSLTSLLPDAIPARWPSLVDRAAQEEVAGWHEGAVACGPLKVSAGAAGAAEGPAWWRALLRLRPSDEIARVAPAVCAVRDPALHTTLLRTGPPLA